MKKFNVKIKGISPYMQHRMDDIKLEDWEKNRKIIIERPDISKEDFVRAEYHSYKDPKTNKYYIPSEHIRGSLINAGCYHKSKVGNAKRSMKNIVAAMFTINPEKIYLKDGFTIDKRSAVNKNIKARIIAIRPKWEEWEADFEIQIDNDTITRETTKAILETAGNYVGIGSFSPRCSGNFGRFIIEKFEEIE